MKEDVLPEGWEKMTLGELITIERGSSPRPIKSFLTTDDDGVNWVKIGDTSLESKYVTKTAEKINKEGAKKSKAVFAGDLILSNSMSLGRPYIMAIDGYIHDGWFVLRVPETASTDFLYYLLSSSDIQAQFTNLAVGGVVQNIRSELVKQAKFNLPPLPEQQYLSQKLTALLDEVVQTKQRLEAIPALLKQFRQSVLADAVSGRLTEEWRNTKGIKKNWKYEKAQNICDKVQSGSTPRGNPFGKNGTIPFLKVYNIVNQAINFDYKPQFITIEDHSKRSTALPNDILMNIVGPPLGKIAILTEQYSEWNINQAITLFRVNKEILNYKYLYFLLCEGSFIREIEHNLKGSVGQVNISLSQCRDMIIPTPTLEEQTQIVQKVETYFALADEIETQVKTALENVNLLTQSILAKAFSGELSATWRNSQMRET